MWGLFKLKNIYYTLRFHLFLKFTDNTVEFQWLKQLWNYENISRHGRFKLTSVNHSARSGGITGISF